MILENKRLLVEIGTGRGARIEKFFDKSNEKEWVWKPEAINGDQDQELGLNASFDNNWAGGWEEVFPNDAPTKIENHSLSDHGEVWSKNWILKEEPDIYSASYIVRCDSYPISLSKTYKLDPDEPVLSIQYEILSLSPEKLPFIFKFHPALKIEVGDYFEASAMMEPVALEFSRILSRNEKTKFPFGKAKDEKDVSINKALPRDNFMREFVKLSDLKEGTCSLKNGRTKTELEFMFDKNDFPYIWLFQSYGGFIGHYVAMIEPTNAAHYDLAKSVKDNTAAFLNPYEKRTLSLEIRLKSEAR